MAKYKYLKANLNLDTESLFFENLKTPLFTLTPKQKDYKIKNLDNNTEDKENKKNKEDKKD